MKQLNKRMTMVIKAAVTVVLTFCIILFSACSNSSENLVQDVETKDNSGVRNDEIDTTHLVNDNLAQESDELQFGVLSVTADDVNRMLWEGTLEFRVLRATQYPTKAVACEIEDLDGHGFGMDDPDYIVLEIEITNIDAVPIYTSLRNGTLAFHDGYFRLMREGSDSSFGPSAWSTNGYIEGAELDKEAGYFTLEQGETIVLRRGYTAHLLEGNGQLIFAVTRGGGSVFNGEIAYTPRAITDGIRLEVKKVGY
ncbi:MAG: hypothetical protein IKE43_02395 [Coriobacteriales bacterium]|nr:hypothetical protein [Coriobacteriales bacterium]